MGFINIDEVHEILNNLADSLPSGIYRGLNGGIVLREELKMHPETRQDQPLYVLGEYISGPLGKNINIYYGSLKEACRYEERDFIEDKLREVLFHELTHHIESLAGEEDLRIEDIERLKDYRGKFLE